ncbi:hypothetical protein JK358_09785 [Nocardia sp. 2]|uniref:Uncharacterized protein n=1 Tax=Nocardia acididurans TaxID=2802282 RepID=A0ABS1M1Z5_9NOCA|nr:hypothetical protein [Nocardia acididurans]MBL1074687.1 hypothetical protein [Nocardia acididurans]
MLTSFLNDILENPIAKGAIDRANDARDTALATQQAILSLLNLPTATDVETITHRLKSISQRLEQLEDAVDNLNRTATTIASISKKLTALDLHLEALLAERASSV